MKRTREGVSRLQRGWRFALALVGVFLLLTPGATRASGTFISAPNRVDMAYDQARSILYISSGSSVLRYSLLTNQFLTAFSLAGSLGGMDISPDGNRLLVADRQRVGNRIEIFEIDLTTGVSKRVYFNRSFGEGGTFTVAFGNDGAALISSTFEGSGPVTLRRYDPASGASSDLATIDQDTMLTASADGSVIGLAESNSSDGPFDRYRVLDGNLLRESGYSNGTSWFNYEIGVSRDGSQYAIPTYGGTFLYDSDLQGIATIGQYAGGQPIGVVYDPFADVVYFAWAGTSEVRAFDTNTFTQIAAYDFQSAFSSPGDTAFVEGRLKISRDGSYLFATVNGGVRFLQIAVNATVSGAVTLEGAINRAQPVTFAFRPTDGSAGFTRLATLDANGKFGLVGIPRKQYNVRVKGPKWLAKVIPIDASQGSVTNVTVTLLGGDANNDNHVDNLDLGIVAAAYATQAGDPNFDPRADLNCNGEVSNLDLGLLANNYGADGDL